MLQLKPSKGTFHALIGGTVLLLAATVLVYWQGATKLHRLHHQVSIREKQRDQSADTARRLVRVENECLTARAELSILEQGVSTKAYVPTFLRQLEELGKSKKLKVVGVRPRPVQEQPAAPPPADSGTSGDKTAKAEVKKPDPYNRLELDLELNGKYWDVLSFVQQITRFPKIVTVNSLQVLPMTVDMDDFAGSPVLTVKLSATAFILKEERGSRKAPVGADKQASGSTSGGKV